MFDRQTKKFCAAVVEALPELSEDVMQGWIGNPTALQKVLREALCPPESKLNYAVSVNRLVRPPYPDWVKKVTHPELESTGPADYNLRTDVELWLHPDQQNGVTSGNAVYASLKENDALADQLGLADLLAIQEKGIAVFRGVFKNNVVFGWKSVVQNRRGYFHVPCLYGSGGKVVLRWDWLDYGWGSYDPAVRFRK